MVANTISTPLNGAPYWDDYDPSKGFVRILYRPGFAVQGRELTQTQTMIQRQITDLAENVFKDGSIVTGCQFVQDSHYGYIKVRDNDSLNHPISLSNFNNTFIEGQFTGVKAVVVGSANGSESTLDETKTLFVKYISGGNDPSVGTFSAGEQVVANNGFSANIISSNTSIGEGYNFTLNRGVVFAKGYMVEVPTQSIVLDRYTNTPTYRVGLNINEQVVTETDDFTLLDPAQGSYNFAAPGAHRLKLSGQLVKYALSANTGPDFAELFTIQNGQIASALGAKTQYNIIEDEIATRLYEQSGDFTVKGLNVIVRENHDDGSNGGYDLNGNTSMLTVGVEPGEAYVKGYQITKYLTDYVNIQKADTYTNIADQQFFMEQGNYFLCNELVGSWDVSNGTLVTMYDTAQKRITDGKWSTGAQTGSAIGTFRIAGIHLDQGTAGAPDAVWRVYITDLFANSAPISSARSVYGSGLGADFVLNSANNTILQESTISPKIFPLPNAAIRSVRDEDGNIATSYQFQKTFSISIGTGGTFTVSSPNGDEVFPYTTGASLDNVLKENFVVSLTQAATVSMTGTVNTTANSSVVNGFSTTFASTLNPGDKLKITGVTNPVIVKQITNNTTLTTVLPIPTGVTGQTFVKQYEPGDIIDFSINGASGVARTVTSSTTTSVAFDMKETLSTTVSASVNALLLKTPAREIRKNIRKNRYVQIDCGTAGTSGIYGLGFADVYQINSIRKDSAAFLTSTQGSDVTSSFTLDNGQRDDLYNIARILNTGGTSLDTNSHLLINLDYFAPDFSQGVGYFSVDSYPIDDVNGYANTVAISTYQIPEYTSTTSGFTYDLRNCIDMRWIKQNTANDAITVGGATVNPADSTSFVTPTGGIHQSAPDGTFNYSYSFFLPRKDSVTLTKTGQVKIVTGVPAQTPTTPAIPDDSMPLATLLISPYPSLAPAVASKVGRFDEAVSVNKINLKRFTMRDIGVLQSRIDNLEAIASLNFLQQNAINQNIQDANGLDRFKNGIFVDSFSTVVSADYTDPDYHIAIDSATPCIRPVFDLNKVNVDYLSGSNIKNSNNVITLTYTEAMVAEQPYVSSTRNAAGLFYSFKGRLTLDPSIDNWVDTQRAPAITVTTPTSVPWTVGQTVWSTQWSDWTVNWTGTSTERVYARQNYTEFLQMGGAGHTAAIQLNAFIDVRTTTTSQSRNQTITTYDGMTAQTQSLGDKIIATSVIPYIRPQVIRCNGIGMKFRTKLFTFFDGEAMNAYVTPTDDDFNPTGSIGDDLVTDNNGNVWFLLTIPSDGSKQFTTGSKIVKISDSIDNSDDASTTSAQATFTAAGLLETVQDTLLTTMVPEFTTSTVTQWSNTSIRTNVGQYDPLAETFAVSLPTNVPGYSVTSIDLFFQTKDPNFGAIVQLRTVDNAGNIESTIIPYSSVQVEPADIHVSADGLTPTNIKFEAPIYLLNGQQYAFVVIPVNNNPNTTLWTAVLGESDINTGYRITTQPYTGVMFISSNNNTWSPIQTEDIKFTLYRAVYSQTPGTVNVANESIENLHLNQVSSDFTYYGEPVQGDATLTLQNVTGGTVANTYFVTGATSHTTGQIMKVDGTTYTVRNATVTDANTTFAQQASKYIVGETLSFTYANSAPVTGLSAQVHTQSISSGFLFAYQNNGANNFVMKLTDSTGTFKVGERIRGLYSNTTAVVDQVNDYKFDTISPQVSFIAMDNTSVTWNATLTSNTYTSTASTVVMNDNETFLQENLVMSRSNEKQYLSGNQSLKYSATLSSVNDYNSPVIDLNTMYAILVHNIVNNDVTGENGTHGGACYNRYLSQKITLADGNDAEDLLVYLTVYRPPTTDVHVYYKLLHAEDSDTFDDVSWVEMEVTSKTAYSDASNPDDFIDFTYGIPDTYLTGDEGQVQYQNSNGVTFTGYKYFAIKICLTTPDSSLVPKASSLRAIALQI